MIKKTLLLSTLLLTGCVGVLYRQDTERSLEKPALKQDKGEIGDYQSERSTPYTKQDVLKLWGEPAHKDMLPNGHEVWTYSHGLSWHGYMPMLLIVPIPLMAPAGTMKTHLEFDGQKLVKASYEDFMMKLHACGLLPVPHGFSFTCY